MEPEQEKEEQPLSPERETAVDLINSLKWPVAVVMASFFIYLASTQAFRAVETTTYAPAATVDRIEKAASSIAERFRSGKITTTFNAALPKLLPDGGTTLGLATLESTETIRRSDERRVLFDLVDLGTNVSEIRVPTTYRYHVRLNDTWRIDAQDQSCIVHAPMIRPTLPPAIHTDRMEKQSQRGWLRFDDEAQMEKLVKSITPTVSKRAEDPETIELVRDQARQRVAEFVRNWLLNEDHWRSDRYTSVTVIFADEESENSQGREATIELPSVDEPGRPTEGPDKTTE